MDKKIFVRDLIMILIILVVCFGVNFTAVDQIPFPDNEESPIDTIIILSFYIAIIVLVLAVPVILGRLLLKYTQVKSKNFLFIVLPGIAAGIIICILTWYYDSHDNTGFIVVYMNAPAFYFLEIFCQLLGPKDIQIGNWFGYLYVGLPPVYECVLAYFGLLWKIGHDNRRKSVKNSHDVVSTPAESVN